MLRAVWNFVTWNKGEQAIVMSQIEKEEKEKKEQEKKEKLKGTTGRMNGAFSENQDALGGFDNSLATDIETLNRMYEELLEKKLVLLGFEKTEKDKHIKQSRTTHEGQLTIGAAVVNFLEGIFKVAISTPHQNLKREEDKFSPEIIAWNNNLEKIRNNLKNAKSEEEIKNAEIELIDEHLHLLEELMDMINRMQRDLSVNEGEMEAASLALETGVKAVILALSGIIYPNELGFKKFFRQQAAATTEEERKVERIEVQTVEEIILKDLQNLSVQNQSPKNDRKAEQTEIVKFANVPASFARELQEHHEKRLRAQNVVPEQEYRTEMRNNM